MVPRHLTDASLSKPWLVCYSIHDEPTCTTILPQPVVQLFSSTRARASIITPSSQADVLAATHHLPTTTLPHHRTTPSHYLPTTTLLHHSSRITLPSQPHYTTFPPPHSSTIAPYQRNNILALHRTIILAAS
jgi:hypothetical protein